MKDQQVCAGIVRPASQNTAGHEQFVVVSARVALLIASTAVCVLELSPLQLMLVLLSPLLLTQKHPLPPLPLPQMPLPPWLPRRRPRGSTSSLQE